MGDLDRSHARSTRRLTQPIGSVRSALLRVAAVILALATAVFLIQLGRAAEPRPAPLLLGARALTIAALLHAGLFMVPHVQRRWQRLSLAAAMLPGALIVAGITGQAISRFARGAPVVYLSTAIAALGVVAYGAAYWTLARHLRKDA